MLNDIGRWRWTVKRQEFKMKVIILLFTWRQRGRVRETPVITARKKLFGISNRVLAVEGLPLHQLPRRSISMLISYLSEYGKMSSVGPQMCLSVPHIGSCSTLFYVYISFILRKYLSHAEVWQVPMFSFPVVLQSAPPPMRWAHSTVCKPQCKLVATTPLPSASTVYLAHEPTFRFTF